MKDKNLTSKNIANYLLKEIPEFQSFYEKQPDSEDLESLLEEFTRFVLHQYRQLDLKRGDPQSPLQLLKKCLDFMEKGFCSPDPELQELISVYFLENLQGEEYYEEIREMLGPRLREELRYWE